MVQSLGLKLLVLCFGAPALLHAWHASYLQHARWIAAWVPWDWVSAHMTAVDDPALLQAGHAKSGPARRPHLVRKAVVQGAHDLLDLVGKHRTAGLVAQRHELQLHARTQDSIKADITINKSSYLVCA